MRRPNCRTILWLCALLGLAGCAAAPLVTRLALPERFTVARHQLLIHSDFTLPQHHRMLDELIAQRGEMTRQLAIPASDEPIHVYLFDSSERFASFMKLHHPEFPNRRAFFLESDTRLSVYAQWGDRMAEDLRHEVAHAYLHAVVPGLPLWLDEGLAEYYEVPRTQRGLNRAHVERLADRMRRHAWQPDLKKLERLRDDRDLDQDEYAESWAWVHFMLESRPETAEMLRSHLTALRTVGQPEPPTPKMQHLNPDAKPRERQPPDPLSAVIEKAVEQPAQALQEHIGGLAPYMKGKQHQMTSE